MKDYITNNAKWVRLYDVEAETKTVKRILEKMNKIDSIKSILDVGCGSGRSIDLINHIFDTSTAIVGIDKQEANVRYCKSLNFDNTQVYWVDAFDYLAENENSNRFDLILFSWSFFDMVNEPQEDKKVKLLRTLIYQAKECLTHNGLIIVLQPTKGGLFEQFLSLFMPGSGDDYLLIHRTLIELGFKGAKTAFPKQSDVFAIWSRFIFDNIDDLYCGVESILYLEQRRTLNYETFLLTWNNFIDKHREIVPTNDQLSLTDCVNLYYMERNA